ncbi:transcriptional regulator yeeY [Klebsiella michiganensis]|nr:transcriptional regulator yeeY [Klebsiella michiganensis]
MRLNLDVLLILDALDKHGSFATAAESLFKTPAALSYMIQKLENDLNITLLDRSGHRAKFTDTGRMMLEKGRLLLNAAKDLEKQAVQLSAGWERDLAIALDDSFPFSALLPLIDAFYASTRKPALTLPTIPLRARGKSSPTTAQILFSGLSMNRRPPPNGRGKCSAPWTIFSSSRRGIRWRKQPNR